jgi:ATP-binding cassette subfamily B protein
MSKRSDQDLDIRVVSALPGRVRWEVRGLRGNRAFAAVVEQKLMDTPGMVRLEVSHITGRILILFDLEMQAEAIREHVRDAMLAARTAPTALQVRWESNGLQDLEEATRLLAPFSRELFVAAGLSALAALCNIARDIVLGMAVNILRTGRAPLVPLIRVRSVAVWSVGLGGLAVVLVGCVAVLKYASLRIWRRRGRMLQHQLRNQLFAHVEQMETAALQECGRGELLGVLGEDIDRLEGAVDAASWLMNVSISSAVFIGALFIVAPRQAWVSLLPIPILIGRAMAYFPRLRLRYAKARQDASAIAGHVRSNLDGISTVKSFILEAQEQKTAESLSDQYRRSSAMASAMATGLPLSLEATIQTGVVLTLLTGQSVSTSNGRAGLGAYTGVGVLLYHIFYPLISLSIPLDNLERGLTAYARVRKILSLPLEAEEGLLEINPEMVRGEIAYENVDFDYPNGTQVFKDLSLKFVAGSATVIVGPSGSGKSTLVNLLLGFFPPHAGRILLDGEDVRRLKPSSLRKLISLVSQDVFLFPRTVLENIRVGRPDASTEEVISAAKLASAHDFILQLPLKYETQIGDRGERLSGGQKQRIAIARAILKDAPILILDEGTSHLHPRMEDELQGVLRNIFSGRTLIIITHRLSPASDPEWIYVLEKGQVVEQGRRAELISYDSEFERLGFADI